MFLLLVTWFFIISLPIYLLLYYYVEWVQLWYKSTMLKFGNRILCKPKLEWSLSSFLSQAKSKIPICLILKILLQPYLFCQSVISNIFLTLQVYFVLSIWAFDVFLCFLVILFVVVSRYLHFIDVLYPWFQCFRLEICCRSVCEKASW